MQTTTAQYNETRLTMPEDDGVDRKAPRYVFTLGDFIEPGDKRQLRGVGGELGGLRVGLSPKEGTPTMWRTNGFIHRAHFVPLEITATVADSDHREGVRPLRDGISVYEVNPGGDAALLSEDSYKQQGVVELTALRNIAWAGGTAQALNKVFFPDLDGWREDPQGMPVLLSDYVSLVTKVDAQSDIIAQTKDEILESARAFAVYAKAQIEKNRQAIMRIRNTDAGGFTLGWQARTRLFAAQLGITLEDDNVFTQEQITVSGAGVIREDTELKAREIAAQEEANELKRQELEFLRLQFAAKAEETKKVEKK
jgi:hypothetical protein